MCLVSATNTLVIRPQGLLHFCSGGRVGARPGGIGVRELIMAKGYRRVDRDQPLLLPADMREWIRDDPVWLVIEIIEQHLDTSAFHAGRRVGGVGRAGYDPDVLLTLLVWAWTLQCEAPQV